MQIRRYEGGQITVPGIYSKVPMAAYHSGDICDGPSLSSSGMKSLIWESEEDFWDKCPLNPKRVGMEADEKRAFALGRAVHHICLGEPKFAKLFVIRPDEINGRAYHWANKDWQRWKDQQKAAGRTILTQKEGEQCFGMAVSLGKQPLVQHGLLNGFIEHSIFWKDKKTGIWLKSRPDVIPQHCDDLADLKTTRSVRPEALQKTIADFAYYQQGALIREAWIQMFGRPPNSFNLVFVKSTRPYSAAIRQLEPEDLDRGADLNRIAIDKFATCLKTGIWPGPAGFQRDAASLALSQRVRDYIEIITGIKRGIQ